MFNLVCVCRGGGVIPLHLYVFNFCTLTLVPMGTGPAGRGHWL